MTNDKAPSVLLANLKLFNDIAHCRSISRGAEENRITQSAASQNIQEVERKLGVKLLDRSTRPFTLTAAGKLYAEFCRDLLKREQEFRQDLSRQMARVEGEVRVASIYSIGLSEMTRLRKEFHDRYPQAKLQVDYLRPQRIYEALLEGRADLGLVSYPEATRDLAVIPWRSEEMVVAAAPDHLLAQSNILLPSDLRGHDFVAFDEELSIRREIDRFFRDQGVELQIVMTFDNIQAVKEAVAFGSGISVLPARTFELEIKQGRLVAVPLLAKELMRPVGIVYRRKQKFPQAVESFIELLTASVPAAR